MAEQKLMEPPRPLLAVCLQWIRCEVQMLRHRLSGSKQLDGLLLLQLTSRQKFRYLAAVFDHRDDTVVASRLKSSLLPIGQRPSMFRVLKDARRYRWLRERDLDTIPKGGVFAGITPDNLVLNGEDLDRAVDAALEAEH